MKRLFAGQVSPVILDGGMGTQLASAGWRPPLLPEEMVLEDPEAVRAIHRAYAEAGARIVETDTFGGSALKLAHRGLEGRTEEINARAAELARIAVGDRALVAGCLGPIGRLLEPLGDLSFDGALEAFLPQASGLARGGADFLLVETMLDLQEAKAAAAACKAGAPRLPFAVSFTFDKDGATVTGTTPEAAAVWAEAAGAFAVGANCGLGPEGYVETVRRLVAATDLPVFVYPNAGVPSSRDYLGPEAFAAACEALVRAGASVVRGCCGTTRHGAHRRPGGPAGGAPHPPLSPKGARGGPVRRAGPGGGGGPGASPAAHRGTDQRVPQVPPSGRSFGPTTTPPSGRRPGTRPPPGRGSWT